MLAIRTTDELSTVRRDLADGLRLAETRFIGFSISSRMEARRKTANALYEKWRSRHGGRETSKAGVALLAATVDTFEKAQADLARELTAFIRGSSGHFCRKVSRLSVDADLLSEVKRIRDMIPRFEALVSGEFDNFDEIAESFYGIYSAINDLEIIQAEREAVRTAARGHKFHRRAYA